MLHFLADLDWHIQVTFGSSILFKSGAGGLSVEELENVFIPVAGGRCLSARIWLPDMARQHPVPAILEYLPYRKRDGTAQRDESTYPVFARAGYAGVRVDISGTGESDGCFDDEYSEQEHADALEVIEWIAAQPWCDGNLGMMGISWGGFNSLQVAALRPEPLKAVIAIGTTVDRYNDDIHYKGGCLLSCNFSWSATMLSVASKPPDPVIVGERWRKMWQQRLETQPFPLEIWLSHQRRDEYWKRGSVCECYDSISTPSLVISGWGDGYVNAPPAMVRHSIPPSRAINGPWVHHYPHQGLPGPAMDFHREAVGWWDCWLKGKQDGIGSVPDYRAYILENVRPGTRRMSDPGRWVSEVRWPPDRPNDRSLYLIAGSLSDAVPQQVDNLSVCSPQDCGTACGEFFPMQTDGEMPGDQRLDDAGSLVFQTPCLESPLEVLGRPRLRLRAALDRPIGNLIARLVDVQPDGTCARVTWGVLNLAHRRSQSSPAAMEPGVFEDVDLVLNECGYRFPAGHRLRISLSTAYWPMVLPPPERVTVTIACGPHCRFDIPVRQGGDADRIPKPVEPVSVPENPGARFRRGVERNLQENLTSYRIYADTGTTVIPGHGMNTRHVREECWSIRADDPLSCRATAVRTSWLSREDWEVRTICESTFSCDESDYLITACVMAYEGNEEISKRSWECRIPRDFT